MVRSGPAVLTSIGAYGLLSAPTRELIPHLRTNADLLTQPLLPHALILLRVTVALLFMAHAVVRLSNGSVPNFAAFLAAKGFPLATLWVWAISLYEVGAGTALILNRCVRWCAAGLVVIAATGIVLIHAANGWFVGEHGSGGSEYSVCLIAALAVVMAADGASRPSWHRAEV
jgi:putative oxidoreductase